MKQFLKKTKRFIMHYWLSISLGMIATPFAIQYAYQDRGRLAFGGEYLVLPAMVMGAYLLRQVVPAILEMIYELIYGEEEPEDDTSGNRSNRTGNVADYRRVSEADRNRRRSTQRHFLATAHRSLIIFQRQEIQHQHRHSIAVSTACRHHKAKAV